MCDVDVGDQTLMWDILTVPDTYSHYGGYGGGH